MTRPMGKPKTAAGGRGRNRVKSGAGKTEVGKLDTVLGEGEMFEKWSSSSITQKGDLGMVVFMEATLLRRHFRSYSLYTCSSLSPLWHYLDSQLLGQ